MPQDKKLHNRFDEYEICSVFTQYCEEQLPKKWNAHRHKFYLKCLLGTLLFINGYLSHWGPWPWPTNYYFLIFSVIFYHTATYIYGSQSPVKNAQGNTIGEYKLKTNGNVVTAVVRIGKSKKTYSFQTLFQGKQVASKQFNYYDYFTESGIFLSKKFKKILEEVVEKTQKQVK